MKERYVSVVCMKWGTLYGSHYVNRLYGMVARNLNYPFKFYCITDDTDNIRSEVLCRDIPDFEVPETARGPWRKLLMFKPQLFDIRGKTMFLDLDVVIIGGLDRFFSYSDKFAVRHEFDRRKENDTFGNTSMYVFEAGSYPQLYKNYLHNQEAVHKQFWTAEQEYVTRTLYSQGELDFFPNEWILSFKEHCLPSFPQRWWKTPKLPQNASILAFHGRPLPEDALQGVWPLDGKAAWKRLYKYVKPCVWIGDYWRE